MALNQEQILQLAYEGIVARKQKTAELEREVVQLFQQEQLKKENASKQAQATENNVEVNKSVEVKAERPIKKSTTK